MCKFVGVYRFIEFYEFVNVMTSVVGSQVQVQIRNRIADLKGLFYLFDYNGDGSIEVLCNSWCSQAGD